MRCITFGSPRVGNRMFRHAFHSLVGTSYRLVHGRDPVPALPPSIVYALLLSVQIWTHTCVCELYVWDCRSDQLQRMSMSPQGSTQTALTCQRTHSVREHHADYPWQRLQVSPRPRGDPRQARRHRGP